ncbi:MAG: hypothetical protein IPM34_09720 [Saprospiraceae bacterium]|nr:hypothetical protein [Saprospiraceae bacterium]
MKLRISKLVKLFSEWRKALESLDERHDRIFEEARADNPWFTENEIRRSILAICRNYLDESAMLSWMEKYADFEVPNGKSVGIVAAGNIPFVSFHDLFCALVCNYKIYLKLSDKDKALPVLALKLLQDIDDGMLPEIQYTSKLQSVDKFIITGSSLALSHFQPYLKGKPSLTRGHRNSVAVLSGNENANEVEALGQDVFHYFGLGCRNVTKLYIPKSYDFTGLLRNWDDKFLYLKDVVPYVRNLEYQKAVKLINRVPFLESEIVLLEAEKRISPPISTLYFEEYESLSEVVESIQLNLNKIQCVCCANSLPELETIKFGVAQNPGLSDYQDHVDTMLFLLNHDEKTKS